MVTLVMYLLCAAMQVWATVLYLAGKVGATMSLNALYVYTAELFPTRARHRLLAACSMLGRIGSILAPLTPLLVSVVTSVHHSALPGGQGGRHHVSERAVRVHTVTRRMKR